MNLVSEIASGPLDEITSNSDLLSIARLARGIPGMRNAIDADPKFPFGSPCLLHSDPIVFPDDRTEEGINAKLMPLDLPSADAFVPCAAGGPGLKHWAGANGEWVALVQDHGRWYLLNVYSNVEIEVPSVQNVGIFYHHSPFHYHHDMAHIRLNKIHIASPPQFVGNRWRYDLIAVFDKFIAIMRGGRDVNWKVLRNDYLAPSRYVDAILDVERVYAVTAPRGDVLLWEPTVWGAGAGPRVIPAPVIEDIPGGLAGGGEDQNDSRCWFLAMSPSGNIIWVHTRGERVSQGATMNHMGRDLLTYPSLVCHVYSRAGIGFDPVTTVWSRQEELEGGTLFVGINYPFFLHAPVVAGVNGAQELQIFKPNCVFASHWRCNQFPQPSPDWCRLEVSGGPTIGSSFNYAAPNWGGAVEAPMWFVPVLPQGWWGWGNQD